MTFRPKYISFDCYGTLIRFRMTEMAQAHFGDRVSAENMPRLIEDWAQYRFDETLGAWKPYRQVLINSVERLCKRWGLEYDEAFGASVYESVPTWGPHDDVPGGLAPLPTRSRWSSSRTPATTRSSAMSTSWARPSTAYTRRRWRKPTSRACRPSNICSTSWAAGRKR
jgi:hypothetical protein